MSRMPVSIDVLPNRGQGAVAVPSEAYMWTERSEMLIFPSTKIINVGHKQVVLLGWHGCKKSRVTGRYGRACIIVMSLPFPLKVPWKLYSTSCLVKYAPAANCTVQFLPYATHVSRAAWMLVVSSVPFGGCT